MATITITKLHTILAQKLGNDTAENLTIFIEEKMKDEIDDVTKEIKAFVRAENAELRLEIAQAKTDMIKWFIGIFVAFFIPIIILLIGIYFKK